MTIAKSILAGLFIALVAGLIVLLWQYAMASFSILLVARWMLGLANSLPAPVSSTEQERRRRGFVTYQISQDIAARREAHREAMAQWRQQQPPPPDRGDGGRFC